jgi:hypothetical protein
MFRRSSRSVARFSRETLRVAATRLTHPGEALLRPVSVSRFVRQAPPILEIRKVMRRHPHAAIRCSQCLAVVGCVHAAWPWASVTSAHADSII